MLEPIKIHVNCLTGYSPNCFPEYFEEKLVKRIVEVKKTENLTDQFQGDWIPGRRYEDNDRVASVIMGCISQSVAKHIIPGKMRFDENGKVNPLLEMRCLAYTTNMDTETLDKWIIEALDYSGGCDHWYTYEKDWS
jgi:hypothetical protein